MLSEWIEILDYRRVFIHGATALGTLTLVAAAFHIAVSLVWKSVGYLRGRTSAKYPLVGQEKFKAFQTDEDEEFSLYGSEFEPVALGTRAVVSSGKKTGRRSRLGSDLLDEYDDDDVYDDQDDDD